jgi:hypothetical protein
MCSSEPFFQILLLLNIETPIFLRDQHADDVKEDTEERTESEVRTSHEARGSYNLKNGWLLLLIFNNQKFKNRV